MEERRGISDSLLAGVARALGPWWHLEGQARGLNAEELSFSLPRRALPSPFDVSALAVATVTAATEALADLLALHEGRRRAVHIDGLHVAAAFASERYLAARGWTLPPIWDPFAGDYPAADGFVRLHTNYAYHREAALRALGGPRSREEVAAAVARLPAEEVERAVVAAGGCAAALRTREAWAAHPQGRAVAQEPLVHEEVVTQLPEGDVRDRAAGSVGRSSSERPSSERPSSEEPLGGLRVLDLTRVIAGPVATRFLAAYGADVLRIDPPGFEEVPVLLPETTGGKRCAALDLRSPGDRARFEALLAEADVLVHGLRRGALRGLGYDGAALRAGFPRLIVAGVNAYGLTGPWAERRGFDSLVQMSAGIAAHGQAVAKAAKPVPLPVQALDHGTGYLLAAAVLRALRRRAAEGVVTHVHLSLARTAGWLDELGVSDDVVGTPLTDDEVAPFCEEVSTAWGPIRRVRCPGSVEGVEARWTLPPGPLGSAPATWRA